MTTTGLQARDANTAIQSYLAGEVVPAFNYFFEQAKKDDGCAQNLVGFMLYRGEGVSRDTKAAINWFYKAAKNNSLQAHVNLFVVYTIGAAGIKPDQNMAKIWIDRITKDPGLRDSQPEHVSRNQRNATSICELDAVLKVDAEFMHDGKQTFLVYCGGCHGYDGFASYPTAPSFSMGERLQQDDDTLLKSIVNGKGAMPGWRQTLSADQLLSTVHYLRAIAMLRRFNTLSKPPPVPERYLLFPESIGGEFIREPDSIE